MDFSWYTLLVLIVLWGSVGFSALVRLEPGEGIFYPNILSGWYPSFATLAVWWYSGRLKL